MGKREKRDAAKYPDAPHGLTDEEIIGRYGRLLAFHLEWIESAIDVDAVIEMAQNASALSAKQRQD